MYTKQDYSMNFYNTIFNNLYIIILEHYKYWSDNENIKNHKLRNSMEIRFTNWCLAYLFILLDQIVKHIHKNRDVIIPNALFFHQM